jgi:hypothetical protein
MIRQPALERRDGIAKGKIRTTNAVFGKHHGQRKFTLVAK